MLARLIGFGLIPFVSLAAPVLSLPVLAYTATTEQWTSIVIGQSAGTIIAAIITYGWTLRGVVEAVGKPPDQLRELCTEFLVCSGAIAVVAN
jgi:hypothetical protein